MKNKKSSVFDYSYIVHLYRSTRIIQYGKVRQTTLKAVLKRRLTQLVWETSNIPSPPPVCHLKNDRCTLTFVWDTLAPRSILLKDVFCEQSLIFIVNKSNNLFAKKRFKKLKLLNLCIKLVKMLHIHPQLGNTVFQYVSIHNIVYLRIIRICTVQRRTLLFYLSMNQKRLRNTVL